MSNSLRNKMSEILGIIESNKTLNNFEFSVNDLTFQDREIIRYFFMQHGLKAEIYTECKCPLLAIWLR
jgi:hypothetical protein